MNKQPSITADLVSALYRIVPIFAFITFTPKMPVSVYLVGLLIIIYTIGKFLETTVKRFTMPIGEGCIEHE